MSRIPRSSFALEPGYFHIITRGNNRMKIFQDELDYQHYLTLLRYYKTHYQIKIFAYCLMPNHVHLLVETTKANTLPKFMQGLNLAYSLYHKKRYDWNGYLWQGRYKSYLIEKGKYFAACIEYIESNPSKAGLTANNEEYLWCSKKESHNGNRMSFLDVVGID